MSKSKRKRYAAEFKAKVALEAIKGGETSGYESDHVNTVKVLHEKIGQLTVERDFLAKAFGR